MEHRIDIDRRAAGSTRLPLEQFAALRAASPAIAETTGPAPEVQPPTDVWTPSTAGPEAPSAPAFNERVVRARLAAATRARVEDPAQAGMQLLESAVATSHELHRIIAQLDDLVGTGSSAANAEVHRMRIQAQQMLNALRFQHSVSIDGSSLGDTLRSDLDVGGADAASAA